MRDRYSILVGLLFVAIVAIALLNGVPGGGSGTLGLDEQPARWPLPEFAVPAAAGKLEGDANVAQDDCRRRSAALSGRRPPHSRLPGRDAGGDPGLRPLRPPAGDLVLVHARGRRLRRPAGRRQPRLRALPWTGELPLAGRSRRSRHGSRTDPAARLGDAGRLRPRRRRRRASTGSAAARPSPTPIPAAPWRAPASASSTASAARANGSSGCCARPARRGGEAEVGAEARRARSWAGSPPRRRAGSPRTSPPSSPASGSPGSRSTAGPAAAPSRSAPPARDSPTASTARTRSTCANGRSPGPTASSSARSASTPTAPAPRSSSSPSTASTTAASRAAACRPTR